MTLPGAWAPTVSDMKSHSCTWQIAQQYIRPGFGGVMVHVGALPAPVSACYETRVSSLEALALTLRPPGARCWMSPAAGPPGTP